MLLSIFLSFLFAKLLKRKIHLYALVTAIAVFLITFFSVGIPDYYYDSRTETAGIIFDVPLPLSFPFYTAVSRVETGRIFSATRYYHFYFFTFMYHQSIVSNTSFIGTAFLISWGDYILFFSLFLLINITGAAIGYWISIRLFTDRFLKKRG